MTIQTLAAAPMVEEAAEAEAAAGSLGEECLAAAVVVLWSATIGTESGHVAERARGRMRTSERGRGRGKETESRIAIATVRMMMILLNIIAIMETNMILMRVHTVMVNENGNGKAQNHCLVLIVQQTRRG